MVPSPTFYLGGNCLPVDRPLENGTWTDPAAGLTSSGMHPSILLPALTLRWYPDLSLASPVSPETTAPQPLTQLNGAGTRCGAQQSLLLCFPSFPAPVHPRSQGWSHCVGPQGSDCLAAPADGWHRPRASSPGPGVLSTSLGLGDL